MIPPHIRKHFLTEKGRSQLFGIGVMFGTCVFAVNVSSQTLFINKYRNIVHLYRNGIPTPVPPHILKVGEQVLDEMKFTIKTKSYVEFFSVFGFEVFFLGSIKSRHGAYVGIPGNFSYKSVEDIEKSQIMVETKPVAWSSEGGILFQESLVLSEDAQRFAIARQLAHLSTNHFYFFSAVNGMPFIVYTILSHVANNKFYGLYKPLSFRIFVYSFVAAFSFGVWTVMKDILTKYYENKADTVALNLGPNYAKGGVEYYAKALQKNMALRLMMSSGESKFTMFGNENELIRQKHVPFTVRKENAEKMLRSFVNSETAVKH